MKWNLTVLFTCLLLLAGCSGDQEKETQQALPQEQTTLSVPFQGCQTCHNGIRHDASHDLPCIQCHKGNEKEKNKELAHEGLIAEPAHPDFMTESCGRCHPDNVQDCRQSVHFTQQKKINMIREHFGAKGDDTANIATISSSANPATEIELIDDMLRRRCLRCHLYYPGDSYAATQRGTGCAACHMGFSNGKLVSHEMIGIPGDFQCLSCHYANHVGADYYGRYEHDLGNEYRTPFTTREEYFRPYGVEYHDLVPDIHQQRGLSCVDCHNGHMSSNNYGGENITCRACHQVDKKGALPPNLEMVDGAPMLTAKLTGSKHPVPQMRNPAHLRYGEKVACQVCHGQWSFNDTTTHLMRSDSDDYDPWDSLHFQSSSSVENLLYRNLYSDEDELPPAMPDTVTGQMVPGLWYKGFTERRWERMLIRQDSDGRIKVFRPILDLSVSYVDSDEDVIFDNVRGSDQVLLPYTPHTTGKAGIFYLNRFAHILKQASEKAVSK